MEGRSNADRRPRSTPNDKPQHTHPADGPRDRQAKGKASVPEDDYTGPTRMADTGPAKGLASRISASAAGLSRQVLTSTPRAEAPQAISDSLGAKGRQAGQAGQSRYSEGESGGVGREGWQPAVVKPPEDRFRTADSVKAVSVAEAEIEAFTRPGVFEFGSGSGAMTESAAVRTEGLAEWASLWAQRDEAGSGQALAQITGEHASSTAGREPDGAAVVSFLNSPEYGKVQFESTDDEDGDTGTGYPVVEGLGAAAGDADFERIAMLDRSTRERNVLLGRGYADRVWLDGVFGGATRDEAGKHRGRQGSHWQPQQQQQQQSHWVAKDARIQAGSVSRLQMVLNHISNADPSQSGVATATTATTAAVEAALAPPLQSSARKTLVGTREGAKGSEKEEKEGEVDLPAFYCPWYSCHEIFNNFIEYEMHQMRHPDVFPCVHTSCEIKMDDIPGWISHITKQHHDILAPVQSS